MTREQAVEQLRECPRCRRWITTKDCDHCWVDQHTCPPSPEQAAALLRRAVEIGKEAQDITLKIRTFYGNPGTLS